MLKDVIFSIIATLSANKAVNHRKAIYSLSFCGNGEQ